MRFNIKIIEGSLGITQKSLLILRNELSRRIDNEIQLIQIQTNDITCGYLIIDYTLNESVFSGDGFRTDEGGEGGAGFKTAQIIINYIFHIPYIHYAKINCDECSVEAYEKNIKSWLNENYDDIQTEKKYIPAKLNPSYIRR